MAAQDIDQRGLGGRVCRQVGQDRRLERPGIHGVHALFGVAQGHGRQGVAVIAAAEAEEAPLGRASGDHPVLQRHLQRHLDRDRTGLGEEHAGEVAGQHVGQPFGQLIGRLVGQAGEHYMGQAAQLLAHGLHQPRMAVAVTGRPPVGHPVDQLAPVRQGQARAGGRDHGQGVRFEAGIGRPDAVAAALQPGGRVLQGHGSL